MNEEKVLANELHTPALKSFTRRRTLTFGIDDLWQTDLVEMHELSSKNKAVNYILTVIDTFSKFAFAVPVKNKTGVLVTEAFESLLKERQPKNLQTDEGKEFFNGTFKKLMNKHDINHYHTFSDKKAAIVERYNRTLKGRMWKKFTELNTHNWFDMLDDLIDSYNASYHRTIKRAPVEVNKINEDEVRELINKSNKPKVSKKILKVGDIVRISKAKGIFAKGYKFNWSEELFKIKKVLATNPVTYHVEDMSGEELKGCCYNEELMKELISSIKTIYVLRLAYVSHFIIGKHTIILINIGNVYEKYFCPFYIEKFILSI